MSDMIELQVYWLAVTEDAVLVRTSPDGIGVWVPWSQATRPQTIAVSMAYTQPLLLTRWIAGRVGLLKAEAA